MARCPGITRSGQRCKAQATEEDGFCFSHSSETEARRKRPKSRAGRLRAGLERLAEIDAALDEMVRGVKDGTIERATAMAVGQLLNYRIRLATVEADVRYADEMEETIAELRGRLERAKEAGQLSGGIYER
jgi:hypothetical protein